MSYLLNYCLSAFDTKQLIFLLFELLICPAELCQLPAEPCRFIRNITCMQLLLGTRITAICFSEAFHFSVLRMHNGALVTGKSELMWGSFFVSFESVCPVF